MKKLTLIFCLLIGILACKKEEIKKENCNCGRILSDDVTNYSIKVRNNCTGNEKTFILQEGDWMNAYVGSDICLTNEPTW
jgi:hypothetical protein